MWCCYTIRKVDNFKHLSMVTEDLQEIYDFISQLTSIDADSFIFVIERRK